MLGQRHEIAHLQSVFYREKLRRILRWLWVSLALVFLLIAGIAYLILFQPTPHYYANTSDGKILEMPQVVH